MLRGAFCFLILFASIFLVVDFWKYYTRRNVEQIEINLLARGHDILIHLPCNNSSEDCNLFVRQDYFKRDDKFASSRGLYANTTNGTDPVSVVALKVPRVLTVGHDNPLHFDVDHSQILMQHELLAVAGPFITSAIPLEAIKTRSDVFHRVLVLGSGVGSISGYYAEEAKTGGILVEAVETNNDILSTGQKFFDNSNTSRVTYLNEDLMKMVDHSFKMGIKYDSIHVGPCDFNATNCPLSRPDKLALILSKNGTLSISMDSKMDNLTESMKKYNDEFKGCFQVGKTEPIQIIFCNFQEVKSSTDFFATIRANAVDFDQLTGLKVTPLITVKE